jgi:hypothetical protein
MNVDAELDAVTMPLVAALKEIAVSAISRHLKARDAWTAMSKVFDGTKDAVLGFAVKIGRADVAEQVAEGASP